MCYHPLFVFNQFGDLERCALRPGNVHSADGWRDVLEPVVARYRHKMKRRYFRGDAAFANPEVYELLEVEGYKYTIRLPANSVLQDRIGWLLKRPLGRPPHEVRRYYASFRYQAGSWIKPRRVVAKVEWHPGELYPRVGFIVTNMTRPAERVVISGCQQETCVPMQAYEARLSLTQRSSTNRQGSSWSRWRLAVAECSDWWLSCLPAPALAVHRGNPGSDVLCFGCSAFVRPRPKTIPI